MTVSVASEQLYCANCSDPVDAVDENDYGRCCHNLPHPWHRGSDGLYTEPSDSEDAEDEDDEDEPDRRPSCPYCGEGRFRIHAREWRRIELTTTADGFDNDAYDDASLWYEYGDLEDDDTIDTDGFEITQVVCLSCHNDVTGRFDVEQL